MTKDNILFGIVGLLLGLIIGFIATNSINQQALVNAAPAGMKQTGNLPEGHPDINNGVMTSPDQQNAASMPQVQAAVELAKNNPNNFEAQLKAAEMYYQISRFDDAINFLKQANQLKPDDYETIVNLANANFDGSHFEEAEKWYSAALVKKADDVNVRTDLGLTFLFRDPPNYDRGIQEFERSLATDPNHVQTLQNLTVAYTKKGDAAKAKATLAKLESLDPKNEAIAKLRGDIEKMGAK